MRSRRDKFIPRPCLILGLRSKILPPTDEHYLTLLGWLGEAASGVSDWLLCYNHTGPGMSPAAFHERCNDVGATVTLVKVGDNVFGGFSSENWGGIWNFLFCYRTVSK